MEVTLPVFAATAALLLVARLLVDAFFRGKNVYHSRAEREAVFTRVVSAQDERHLATLRFNAIADKDELLDNLELALRLRRQVSLSPAPTMSEAETAERVASIERQLAEAEREIQAASGDRGERLGPTGREPS